VLVSFSARDECGNNSNEVENIYAAGVR